MRTSRFSLEQKKAMIEEAFLKVGNKTPATVAKKNGISELTLKRWRRDYDRGVYDKKYTPIEISVKKLRKKRTIRPWTVEEKVAIIKEIGAKGGGTPSVIEVAKKHNLSSSLLYSWRKQYNEGTLGVHQMNDDYNKVIGFPSKVDTQQPAVPEGFTPSSTIFAMMYGRSDIKILLELYRLDRRDGTSHDEAFTKIIKNVRWACGHINETEDQGE